MVKPSVYAPFAATVFLGLPRRVSPIYPSKGCSRLSRFPVVVGDTGVSGMGCQIDNRYLNSFAESISMTTISPE